MLVTGIFLLFPQCFKKVSLSGSLKIRIVNLIKRVNIPLYRTSQCSNNSE